MSGRERAEAALRAVFHDMAEACCLLGSVRDELGRVVDFEVVEINRAGERMLRRTREAVLGKRLAAVFYDAAAPEMALRVVMTGEFEEEEVEGAMRRMAPAGDGVVVTLRREGEAGPEQASAALERVIGGLAHDFNNLLTPILAYANLGLGQTRPGEPLYEELSEIRRAAERATELVHRVQSSAAPNCSPNDASGDG
jgi:signal transduction histidine kinase